MAVTIPEQYQDLLRIKAFAHLGTLMPDGSPQVNPMWFDYDGRHIRINTAKGRWKDKNMRVRPAVALSIQDPDNGYRYMQLRGKIAGVTEEGAEAHIDSLAKKYIDKDRYPWRQPGEKRISYTVEIERVSGMNLKPVPGRAGSATPSRGGTVLATIPAKYHDLLQKKAFTHLGTLMADSSPQVNPMWFDYDERHILINTAKGRWKDKNMRVRPAVALSIQDPDNGYRYMQLRGKIAEVTEEGAEAHIDSLAAKYINQARYPNRQPGEERVIFKVEIERVSGMG